MQAGSARFASPAELFHCSTFYSLFSFSVSLIVDTIYILVVFRPSLPSCQLEVLQRKKVESLADAAKLEGTREMRLKEQAEWNTTLARNHEVGQQEGTTTCVVVVGVVVIVGVGCKYWNTVRFLVVRFVFFFNARNAGTYLNVRTRFCRYLLTLGQAFVCVVR